jgi:SNF2 family DNA or RNA helicase
MVTLTQDLLIDAGGWAALKEARAIHAAGRVREASYVDGLLIGLVSGGQAEYRSGLRIASPTDMENLCTCMESRRRGVVCAHSLAVGLEVLKPSVKTGASSVKVPTPVVGAVPKAPAMPFSTLITGPLIELHVILPAKFAEAWAKNNFTVVLEISSANQRKPFATWDAKRASRCDEFDATLLGTLWSLLGGKPTSMVILNREQMASVLSALPGHPRVTFGKAADAMISEEALRPTLHFAKDTAGNLTLSTEVPGPLLLAKGAVWRLIDGVLQAVAPGLPAAYTAVLQGPISLPAPAVAGFVAKEVPLLAGFFECVGMDFTIPAERQINESKREVNLLLEGSLNFLAARFLTTSVSTDVARLQKLGFGLPDAKGEMLLKGERTVLTFFAVDLPKLEREWKVTLGERFAHVTRNVERLEARMEVRGSGQQWFELAYDFESAGGEKVDRAEMVRLLQSGQSFVKRGNGKVVVFDSELVEDFTELLRDCNPQQQKDGTFRLANRQAGGLQAFAEDAGWNIHAEASWQASAGATRHLDELKPVALGSLEDKLRDYQKLGVYWLNFLAQNGFGGILADEMGLGKTLQALAFVRTLGGLGPTLIVCPSSLVFNWQAEAARWTPELKVVVLEGSRRTEQFAAIAGAQLVITSYALLRLDVEVHRALQYAAVILDEAQQIKNPDSQNAQAAVALRAKHRFVMTGTPVENSVRDLWSLMHFLMPGYLGTRKEFKERYEGPIGTQPGGPEQQRLVKRIRPFLLRRTKVIVAKELPQKLEQVAWCELSGRQREMYAELAKAARQQLSELAGAKDQKQGRMVMLTALLRLRQAACDVRLLGTDVEISEEDASAKLELLMELLTEAQEGGHCVLVFSQFVKMLTGIRSRLDAEGVNYCYLDGSSKDRAEQVLRFQTGTVPVFLISLKAGGTGLTLTAADTVIHFDPWWNPAVEAQATDRAHRIGQTKVVTSYKLIARNTVEEKILALQAKKRTMIAATLESEQPMLEGLTMDEIRELVE